MANLYRDEAAKRWPDATIQSGRGSFAVLSACPPLETVMLYRTRAEAERAKAEIDSGVCGGQCRGSNCHRIIDLSTPE